MTCLCSALLAGFQGQKTNASFPSTFSPWKTASYSSPIFFVHRKLTNRHFSITLRLLDFDVSSEQALHSPPCEVLCRHPYSWMENPSSMYPALLDFSATGITDGERLRFLERSCGVREDEAALLITRARLDDPWLALSRVEEESKGRTISWAAAGSWCLRSRNAQPCLIARFCVLSHSSFGIMARAM